MLYSLCLQIPKEPTGSKHLVSNNFSKISVLSSNSQLMSMIVASFTSK